MFASAHRCRGVVLLIVSLLLMGCGDGDERAHNDAPTTAPAAAVPTNRIDIPPAVRENLGITFAKVELRPVAATIRVPGRFELLPTARREHRATLSGWVTPLVDQYQRVEKGTPLYRLESPQWHEIRQKLHDLHASIDEGVASLAVAQTAKAETTKAIERLESRINALAGAEVRRVELEMELAAKRDSLPRLEAEMKAKEEHLEHSRQGFRLALASAASVLGSSVDQLSQVVDSADGKVQRWYTIDRIERTADVDGVVESIDVAPGAWVEQNGRIAAVIDPAALRFRAVGMQADLGKLKDGQSASIVPPAGSGIDPQAALPGKLNIGIAGDPQRRTIELLVTPDKLADWARSGVSAFAEITTAGGNEQPAIPVAAIVRDELRSIYFRRDPKNPDVVIRTDADLGVSDGRWVVVKSGVIEGDEVVLDGVYELKLTGGAGAPTGGHFHADGTWHAGPDK